MGQFRKADDPSQGLLLPSSPRDWLPEGHLAWFIMETVEQLDLDALTDRYRVCGKGELAYPPRVMLQLLIYAYCTGTFSSRRIAAQVEDSIAFRVLACGLKPSHRTICRFREAHLDEFQKLFVQVVQIAEEAGVVKMGVVAIDGSKMKANASKHKAMSYDRMLSEQKRLRDEISKLTRAAKNQDELDDKEFGPDFRGDELPAELSRRKDRLATITKARKRLEERKAAEDEAKRAPGKPKEPGPAQNAPPPAGAAKAEQPAGGDRPKPASGACERTEAAAPKTEARRVLPEPRDQENFTDPDSRIMPTGRNSFEQAYNAQVAVDAKKQFIVAAEVTQSTNDNGQLLPVLKVAAANTGKLPSCLLADAGYRNEVDFAALRAMKVNALVALGREGSAARMPGVDKPCTRAMRKKITSKRGRAKYRLRKAIVEPVFGWLKRVLGFRTFSLRGLRKVTGEWSLVCMALNLRRMATMQAAR
jgi:transposase